MTMDTGDGGIRSVVLRRSSEGLGFSIMGGAGYEFPPVIYGIEKDSPAARSGTLEAGDIILAINEREVVKLSTKEVLKCLRLSGDIVNIKYKRDPHVVSRVRQFLSTPHYLEEGDGNIYYNYASTQVTITTNSAGTPSSPYKSSGPGSGSRVSKIRQPSVVTTRTSPTRTLPPGDKSQTGDQPDPLNPNHISFSDDLFINHSHHQAQQAIAYTPTTTKSMIPVRSPTHSAPTSTTSSSTSTTNGGNKSSSGNKGGGNQNSGGQRTPPAVPPPRKHFEAFVMTGDAILNVSKLRNDDSIRSSPTKTSSKLTPLSHGPAPPHQIYSARLTQPVMPVLPPPVPVVPEKSETSEVSPPLPPPPTSNSTSSSTSDSITHVTVKSDNLPPPPPSLMMEDENATTTTAQSQSNGIAIAEPVNRNNGVVNRSIKPNGVGMTRGDSKNSNNNNEDTSISSSVMSDSGGEELDEEPLIEPAQVTEVNAPKPPEKEEEVPVRPEKERYNEYILFNGTRGGTIEEEEERSSGSAHARGYEKMSTPNDSEVEEEVGIGSDGDESSATPGGLRLQLTSGGDSVSDSDSSDVESMHIAPVTKAVDLPSAERLAKRLYTLDGFKVTNVWRQLSKPNDFCRAVATEFLNYFEFKDESLDVSLRKFLAVCPLRGETQDRERVLTYFSTRYVDCNPQFASQDAVHTLACALMLLNTDMYSGVRDRRMTSKDFIQNLSGLNDGQDFPEPVLKKLYQSIKSKPLVSPSDADDEESTREALPMDPSVTINTKEFKRGYLKRKSIFEFGGKKTPLGKRSWKLYFCRLRELLLSLAPDENSKATVVQTIQPLKLHHAIATVATDYRKRPYVFCVTLADKSQYLFQSSDTREMHSWIDNLNLNAAKFSSPALEAPCGSSKKFEKPLLPSAISRLSSRDQLITHQGALAKWEEELEDLTQSTSGKRGNSSRKKEVKERLAFYKSEIQRYRAFVDVLERHLNDLGLNPAEGHTSEELIELQVLPNPPVLIEMDENGP